MSSFANTGFADFRSAVQFQYIFIIIEINKSNFFEPLPRRVGFVLGLKRFIT